MSIRLTLRTIKTLMLVVLFYITYLKYPEIALLILVWAAYRFFRKKKNKTDIAIRITLQKTIINLRQIETTLSQLDLFLPSEDTAKFQSELSTWQALAELHSDTNFPSPTSNKSAHSSLRAKFIRVRRLKSWLVVKMFMVGMVFLIYLKYPQALIFVGIILAWRWLKGRKQGEKKRIAALFRLTTDRLTYLFSLSVKALQHLDQRTSLLATAISAQTKQDSQKIKASNFEIFQ